MPHLVNVNEISMSAHILCIVPSSSDLFSKLIFLPFFSLLLCAVTQGAHSVFCFSSINCTFVMVFCGTLLLQNLEQVMESVVKNLVSRIDLQKPFSDHLEVNCGSLQLEVSMYL